MIAIIVLPSPVGSTTRVLVSAAVLAILFWYSRARKLSASKESFLFQLRMVRLKAFLERAGRDRPVRGESARTTWLKNNHEDGFGSGELRLRARMKRRQMVRRLEIVGIVAVVAVSLAFGFYYALNANSGNPLGGKVVPASVYASLYQTSKPPYGAGGSAYQTDVQTFPSTVQPFTSGKPILVYVGAEYCMYCAVQRWSLIMALMRFGNFTNLEYMHSSAADGDYATFSLVNSTYRSSYVIFQSYEVYDRDGNPLATLPTNYTSVFKQYGKESFPFINFNDEYYLSGAILDPAILGTQNQTQIISSILAGAASVNGIKQAANLMTAVICKTTGNVPASVCDQSSITVTTV